MHARFARERAPINEALRTAPARAPSVGVKADCFVAFQARKLGRERGTETEDVSGSRTYRPW
jgi:hypothetical protein